MKKLMLGVAMAISLVVAMAGRSLATSYSPEKMQQAIAEAEAVMSTVESQYSWFVDANGTPISAHIAYMRPLVSDAKVLVATGYALDAEELYAAVTEGTKALQLLTGMARKANAQATAPKTQTVMPAAATDVAAKAAPVTTQVEKKVQTNLEKTAEANARLAVAKIETEKTNAAVMTDVSVSTTVVAPAEAAGLEEIEVPATGEVKTWELENTLMAVGIAALSGVLALAGVCAIIGGRKNA